MKNLRHDKILEIIENYDIETQEELLKKLNECGYNVTQATVSRDVKDLKLSKSANSHGVYRYTTSEGISRNSDVKYISILRDTVVKIDYANNNVVFKTHSGMAQAAAAAIDAGEWNEIVGCIAGDDTILVVTRSEESSKSLVKKFFELMKG